MALNFGGGIGISLFVKNEGLDTAVRDSVNKLKNFTNVFNDVQKSVKNVRPETAAFIKQLEHMSQDKINKITKGAAQGLIPKHQIDATVKAMNMLNTTLQHNSEAFLEGRVDADEFEESVQNLTEIWKLASKDGINFVKAINQLTEAMSKAPEEFDEAKQAIEQINPRWEKFTKSVKDGGKEWLYGKKSFGDFVSGISSAVKEGWLEKFKNSVSGTTAAITMLAVKMASGIIRTGFNIFKGFIFTFLDIFTDLGKQVLSFAGGLVSKLIPSFENVGKAVTWLKDKILGLADSFIKVTIGGLNLTTGFEARLVALDKAASHVGANAGLTGAALRKFSGQASSAAIALNMSAEETANASLAYSKAAQQFKDVGLKDFKEVAKVANITGANAGQLSSQLLILQKTFGITGKAADQFMGSFVAFGQDTQDVGKSLDMINPMLETMRQRATLIFGDKGLKAEELNKFALSTVAFGRGLYKATGDAEGSRKAMESLSQGLVEARKDFQNLFAGTNKDISQFHLGLGIATGSIQKSFESMKQGPAEFMQGLIEMVAQSKKAGTFNAQSFNFMRGQLEAVFKDSTPMIMEFLQNADEETLKLAASSDKSATSLSKIAKEYKTGYTLADRYNLAVDRFVMGFRNIGRSQAVDFVAGATKEFSKLNGQLAELAADDNSLLGKFVKKASEAHQLGALAFIPKTLRPMAAAFGTLAKELMPTVEALGSFGISISDLFSPMGLLTTAVVGLGTWFASLYMDSKNVSDVFNTMLDDMTAFFDEIPVYIDNFVSWIDEMFARLDSSLTEGINGVDWSDKWNKLFNAASKALSAMWGVIQKVAQGVWDGLAKGFDPNQSTGKSGLERIGNYIGMALRKAWDWAVNFVQTEVWPRVLAFGAGMFDVLEGSVDPQREGAEGAYSFGTKIGSALEFVWDKIVVPGASKLWQMIKNFFSGFWTGLWGGIGNDTKKQDFATQIGTVVGEAVKVGLGKLADAVVTFVQDNPHVAAVVAAMAGGSFLGLAAAAGIELGAGINAAFGLKTGSEAKQAEEDFTKALDEAGRNMESTIKTRKAKQDVLFAELFGEGKMGMIERARYGLGKMGYVLDNAVSEGAAKQEQAVLDALKAGDQATADSRKRELADFIKYSDNMKDLVEAYADKNNVTKIEAFRRLQEATENATLVSEVNALKQKGYLKDLADTSKQVSEQMVQDLNKHSQAYIDKQKELDQAFKNATPAVEAGLKKLNDDLAKKPAASGTKKKPESFLEGMSDDEKRRLMHDPTLKKTFSEMAKNLDAPVKKTIEEVLSAAFENAYQKVKVGTVKFRTTILDELKLLVKGVTEALASMWTEINSKVSDSIINISDQITKVLNDVKSITSAVETVALGEIIKSNAEQPDGQNRERTFTPGKNHEEEMFNATHNPDWYFLDYRKLFIAEMASLRAEVRNAGIQQNNSPTKPKGTSQSNNKTTSSPY